MSDLEKAKALFFQGGYTCVMVKGSDCVTSNKSGIAPLLEFADSGKDLRGYAAADKIVGKAAALVYAYIGVGAVYGEVVSRSGAEVLRDNAIGFSYKTLADKIINRRGDGICPMEQAVAMISSPSEGLAALKARLANMKN